MLVIDASSTLPWFFDDEATAETDELFIQVQSSGAFVPGIWKTEVANVFWIGERRGRVTEDQVADFIFDLRSLPVTVDYQTIEDPFDLIADLARRFQITVYDASYLELAHRSGLPLATLNQRLKAAAQSLGIVLVLP